MLWVLIRHYRGDSNEYPQHMFLWRTTENYPLITLQSLYNATCYNMDLVITWPGLGSQIVIFL